MSLREAGAITGVGDTEYGRASNRSVWTLQMEASLKAIADAGLTPKDIDGLVTYSISPVVAEDFVTNFGIPDLRFSATTPMGGASCVAAVQCAPVPIEPGTTLGEAAALMLEHRTGALPVIVAGWMIGLLTRDDLADVGFDEAQFGATCRISTARAGIRHP